MPLYIGSGQKMKLHVGNLAYQLPWTSTPLITNGVQLYTGDAMLLKASNGVIITAKKEET